jgi:MerR family transcriptional regulator, light-induced transcriptional regulator
VNDVAPGAEDAGDRLPAGVRIGELSRRVGVSPEVLRAWERRYGVLRPGRSRAGQRLYSAADEQRVRRVLAHMERGFSPAVAARLADAPVAGPHEPAPAAPAADLSAHAAELRRALDRLDAEAAQRALDRLLAGLTLDTVLRDVVLPFLADLGERWERDEVTVGQEHFATAVLTGRLHGLARGWDAGVGPRAVLACPSGERHDVGLLCFALALRERGWRVCFLGADTPADAILATAGLAAAELVVLSAVRPEPLLDVADMLAVLGAAHRVAIGGRGAAAAPAALAAVERLPDDPIAAADLVSAPSAA